MKRYDQAWLQEKLAEVMTREWVHLDSYQAAAIIVMLLEDVEALKKRVDDLERRDKTYS